MALSPIVVASLQAAVISAISNILAQGLAARKSSIGKAPLEIDWVPVFQFVLFAFISTPPNFLWQDFLESSFPAYHVSPTSEAIISASAGNERDLDDEATQGRLVEPKLNKRNTLIKTLLDQTVGTAVNTLLFSVFIHSAQAAMAHRAGAGFGHPAQSLGFLLSGNAVRYAAVRSDLVWRRATAEFFDLVKASWTFWPIISIVNFTMLKSVEARNLTGSLAGLGWGVYMSSIAAQ
ncbi:hypothetical protein B0T22DRAFT_505509 [Podospora appendiculata]|uniref:Mpv17/PMP22 family protein n=1 Tax=Podospora appendiculata TaxID=314037 RepID=A0AAE0XIJ4_9PEZI|nr:hypothetical protein B0T22DRAFT_505509 [Podospora appendiculata]